MSEKDQEIFKVVEDYLAHSSSMTLQAYSLTETSDNVGDKMSDKELFYFKRLEKYLKKHSVTASRDFQNLSKLSPSAARRYLSRFTDLGLLVKIGHNRNRQYQLRQDLP